MAECEHLARTSAYFDGALAPGDEPAAIEHLASCVACQRLLGDAVAIDAVLSEAPRAAPTVPARRRRWPLVVGLFAVAAAAAVVIYAVRPDRAAPRQVALELPRERAVEARFSGERFAVHRPLGVLRGDRATESIALATLAALEQRGDQRDLVAAIASSGDQIRATDLVGRLPADAAGEADRAAVALAGHDPEAALAHAYRATELDPALAAGWWNLAIAARERGLLRVARGAFDRVAARGEPGWADEARADVAALDRDLARELEFPAFDARGRAMVAGGAPITVDDVQRYPAFSRIYLLEALRLAAGPAVDPLRPLAAALDAQTGSTTMRAAADRAAAADPALRARFASGYRAVIARTATPAELATLLAQLARAGHAVDDLRAGAIITGGQAAARLAELRAIVAPWHDPWFDLVVERERIGTGARPGDLRAEPELAAVLATCADGWAFRCGQLAQDLAQLRFETGRPEAAEPWAARAVEWFRLAGAPTHLQTARALLGDLHRNIGRSALARAELDEVVLAVGDASCALLRFASILSASTALVTGDWTAARAALPPATAPDGCVAGSRQGLSTAIDLARQSGAPADLAVARAWLEAARTATTDVEPDPEAVVVVGAARIARGTDPAASAAVERMLATHPPVDGDPRRTSLRTWAFTTLIADAGGRGDWDGALAQAAAEHPGGAPAPCRIVASLDDDMLTVAARTPAGVVGDHRRIVPAELAATSVVPAAILDAVASCPAIAVDARPPLHGRADLLPPGLPWWFAGDAPEHVPGQPRRSVEITRPQPPDSSLPALPDPGASAIGFDARLTGGDSTPTRVLAALRDATYAELHVHGVTGGADDGGAFLALSPDPDGTFALTARVVRRAAIRRGPLVVLAACRAASVAPYLRERWSLPDAFLTAGASAVVAVDVAIPDATARAVFDELHRRVDDGEPVATALAAIRAAAPADSWARRLMLFR